MRTTKAFMASPIDLVNYHGKNHGLLTQIFHLIPYEWLGVSWCFWKFGIPQQSSTYYEIRCSTIFNPYEMLCLLVYNPLYTSFTTVSMAKNLSDWSYVHPTLLTPIGLPRHPMENHYTYIHLIPSKSQWIPWVLSQVLPWIPMSSPTSFAGRLAASSIRTSRRRRHPPAAGNVHSRLDVRGPGDATTPGKQVM